MSQLNVNIIKNRVGSNGPTISGNTNVSGILTATSFSGDGSGLTSLIISGDGNLTNLNVSGVSTFTGNTEFDGNVTIGGTLTYRDVTNIDAVGMITARKGVQILADGFTVTGVSTLSNGAFIPDSQYLNIGNDSDLRLYHTGTASFIEDQGTGNFIIGSNGGVLKITKGADTEDMAVFTPDGSAALYYDNAKKLETSTTGVTVTGDVTATSFSGDLTGTASNASGATGDFSIADKIVHTGDTNTAIRFPAADTFSVDTAGSERLQIDSSGVVKLTQSGSNPRYGSFEASSDAFKLKAFSGNVSHNATMQFFTGADSPTERMRIASAGQIGLGGANYGTSGQVITSNGSGSAPTWQDAGGGAWNLITTVTASGASQADITGTSSTYNKYCLIGRRVWSVQDWFYARFFNNGTIDASNAYRTAWTTHTNTSLVALNAEADNTTYFRPGYNGSDANSPCDFFIYFNDTHTGSVFCQLFQGYSVTNLGTQSRRTVFAGSLNSFRTNTSGIRIYPGSGTINGTFELYGIS